MNKAEYNRENSSKIRQVGDGFPSARLLQEQSNRTKVSGINNTSGKSSSAFRTIGEVAKHLDVQQHVLRFWETKFAHINPLKRGGGRRYYRPEDVQMLESIHYLLYTKGYTIKGVQKMMREEGKDAVFKAKQNAQITDAAPLAQTQAQQSGTVAPINPKQQEALKGILSDLKGLRDLIAG